MNANTLKTSIGFLATMIEKYTPLKFSKNSLEGIYNYLPIGDSVATSGQPTKAQFQLIKEAGYQTVINLAPHDSDNALADERGLLNEIGLRYVHIPVDFKNPTDQDFQQFVGAMNDAAAEKLWVHCAANMRVSAFMYRYRCEVLNADKVEARQDLEKIWEPFGVWKAFVSITQQDATTG